MRRGRQDVAMFFVVGTVSQDVAEHVLDSMDVNLHLPTPSEFQAFPYKPYDIQVHLMRHLYKSIENKNVTIVESPTGTVSLVVLLKPCNISSGLSGKDPELIVRVINLAL